MKKRKIIHISLGILFILIATYKPVQGALKLKIIERKLEEEAIVDFARSYCDLELSSVKIEVTHMFMGGSVWEAETVPSIGYVRGDIPDRSLTPQGSGLVGLLQLGSCKIEHPYLLTKKGRFKIPTSNITVYHMTTKKLVKIMRMISIFQCLILNS